MTLCPMCHDMATKGALAVEEQWEMKATPYNIERGFTQGVLKVDQPYNAVRIGGNLLVSDRTVISIDHEPLWALSVDGNGRMSLSIALSDQQGILLALIESNEWLSGDAVLWDFQADYQYLRIRRKVRDIAMEIDARKEPVMLRANLWHNGVLFRLAPDRIEVAGNEVDSSLINLGLVDCELALDTATPGQAQIVALPETGLAAIVSREDDYERLRESVLAWRRLREPGSVPDMDTITLSTILADDDPCWCGSGRELQQCHRR